MQGNISFLKLRLNMLVVIFLFVVAAAAAFILISAAAAAERLSLRRRRRRLPPGPSRLPIIGNLHQFDKNKPHVHLWRLSKKYGPIMYMKLGSIPTLVISSASLAKQVLKTNDAVFTGRPSLKGQQKLSYNGLDVVFTPLFNDYAKAMRKICTLHLFNAKRVQSFRPIREDEVSRTLQKIQDCCSKQAVNLSEMAMSLTSSIISRVAFGKRYDDGNDVLGSSDERTKSFGEVLHEAQCLLGGFFVCDCFPMLGWVDKLNGMSSRLEKTFKELDSFYEQLIEDHLSPNRPQSMNGDILDILLQLMMMNGQESSSPSHIELTLNHVKGVLMNIFIAGTDTSAAVIVWAMTVLMKEPQLMKKVQAEIRGSVSGKHLVDEDDIQNLPYLKAIIKETLRLCPPSPLLVPRETTERCIIDGYEIQPKTLTFINAWAIGRGPDYWENPYEFMPDRFLKNNSPIIDFRGKDFGLIPFGSGKRVCPGMSMGVATVELALANLLYSFDWELPTHMNEDDIDMDCLPGITMHKKNPLCLIPKPYHVIGQE